jgi:antitoxin component of MazEF toxin-antitoxin module
MSDQSQLLSLRKDGNSTVVTVPEGVLQSLGVRTGDRVVWKYEDGQAELQEATVRVGNE